MKFENTQIWGFKHALKGMRNPKESWDKIDSTIYNDDSDTIGLNGKPLGDGNCIYIGPNDLKLAQTLIRAGSEHRKFMRQIFVSVDITAPLYWWKEFDTYKVGTVANSTSTMHKMASKSITLDCFEIDDYNAFIGLTFDEQGKPMDIVANNIRTMLHFLEELRQKYIETKDKRYWKELIRWLPESWLQTRTVTMTYENLFAMCGKGQRRFHKLNEWSGQDNPELTNFIAWARTLPYAQEFIFIDELEPSSEQKIQEIINKLKIEDSAVPGYTSWEDVESILKEYTYAIK